VTWEGPPLSINNFGLVLDKKVYRNIAGGWKDVLNKCVSRSTDELLWHGSKCDRPTQPCTHPHWQQSGSSNGSNSSRHMSSTNYLHKEPAIWSDAVRTFNSHPHRLVGVPLLAEVVLPLAKYHHHAGCLNSLMYSAPSNWL
jgi:hypothetical protein